MGSGRFARHQREAFGAGILLYNGEAGAARGRLAGEDLDFAERESQLELAIDEVRLAGVGDRGVQPALGVSELAGGRQDARRGDVEVQPRPPVPVLTVLLASVFIVTAPLFSRRRDDRRQ